MEMVLLLHGSYGDSDDNKINISQGMWDCGCDYQQQFSGSNQELLILKALLGCC
jgi:hypothetical protein